MGVFNQFPWVDYHELNLTWVIGKVKDLAQGVQDVYDYVHDNIDANVKQYINDHLAQFLLGAMYDEANTAIRLQPVEVLVDSDHVYMPNAEEIRVLENNDIRMTVR